MIEFTRKELEIISDKIFSTIDREQLDEEDLLLLRSITKKIAKELYKD